MHFTEWWIEEDYYLKCFQTMEPISLQEELSWRNLSINWEKIITISTTNKGIKWHSNDPSEPHLGDVFKTTTKAAKKAIGIILGNADILDKELHTAFTDAESLLNACPLIYQSADIKDILPLTPNDFLFEQVGGELAPESVDTEDYYPKKHWKRVQESVRNFWKRWIQEWLP